MIHDPCPYTPSVTGPYPPARVTGPTTLGMTPASDELVHPALPNKHPRTHTAAGWPWEHIRPFEADVQIPVGFLNGRVDRTAKDENPDGKAADAPGERRRRELEIVLF